MFARCLSSEGGRVPRPEGALFVASLFSFAAVLLFVCSLVKVGGSTPDLAGGKEKEIRSMISKVTEKKVNGQKEIERVIDAAKAKIAKTTRDASAAVKR